MHPKQSARLRSFLLLSLAMLAACSKPASETSGQATGPAATESASPPAVASEVQAMDAQQLRDAAGKALGENRIYAPGGDNAVEYYLALRDKAPQDPAVISALTDLLPYTVIAAEQSLARENLAESQRLVALIEKADPKAPALPRLKQSIAASQQALAQREQDAAKNADAQAKLAEERRQAALKQAAEQEAAQQQAAEQLAAQQRAADLARQQEAARAAAAPPPAPAPAPVVVPAPTPPPPAPVAPAAPTLRAVSQPSPRYPPEALRLGTAGEVLVDVTVDTDGSVSSARVVRSTPARIFDREAVAAVRRWKFAPISAPVTTRRTINFSPG